MIAGDYGHWNIEQVGLFEPEEFFGFIYEIKNKITGQSYIGKKQLLLKKRKKSRHKRDKIHYVDSKWKEYASSCIPLQEDIEKFGKDQFDFTILQLCSGRSELTYSEEKWQYEKNVLMAKFPNGERAYYNKTIAHKQFAGIEKQTEETRRKIGDSHRGRKQPQTAGENNPAKRPEVKKKSLTDCLDYLKAQNISEHYQEAVKRGFKPEQ